MLDLFMVIMANNIPKCPVFYAEFEGKGDFENIVMSISPPVIVFENIPEKGVNPCNQHFLFFFTPFFATILKNLFIVSSTGQMSSARAFTLNKHSVSEYCMHY